jgi:hypothetical protein
VPCAEVAEGVLHHVLVANDGDNAYRPLTDGAAQRVKAPTAQGQAPPFL